MEGKGKGIQVDPTKNVKKISLEKEMEKQRQINSILRQRQNDPLSINKVDPTKPFCYETIEDIVFIDIMHDFKKIPKKSFDTENTNFNQLDFPINEMMFISTQYQIVDKFEEKEEYKTLKLRFHAILGKREEDIWLL